MCTHVPRFQSFSGFLHHFALAKLATTSIRIKVKYMPKCERSTSDLEIDFSPRKLGFSWNILRKTIDYLPELVLFWSIQRMARGRGCTVEMKTENVFSILSTFYLNQPCHMRDNYFILKPIYVVCRLKQKGPNFGERNRSVRLLYEKQRDTPYHPNWTLVNGPEMLLIYLWIFSLNSLGSLRYFPSISYKISDFPFGNHSFLPWISCKILTFSLEYLAKPRLLYVWD